MKGLVDLFKKRKGGRGDDNEYDYENNSHPKTNNRARRGTITSGRSAGDVEEGHGIGRRGRQRRQSYHDNNKYDNNYDNSRKKQQSRKKNHHYSRNKYQNENNNRDEYKQQSMSSSSYSSSSSCSSSSSLSSSSSSSRSSSPTSSLYNNNNNSRNNKRRKKKKKTTKSKSRDEKQILQMNPLFEEEKEEEGYELLTREELFELPARELRKKCHAFGLDPSQVVEKEDLVLMIHGFYRRRSNENERQLLHHRHHHHADPSTFGIENGTSGGTTVAVGATGADSAPLNNSMNTNTNTINSNNNHTPNHLRMPTTGNIPNNINSISSAIPSNSNFPLLNDENEQMVEILFEIVPYYGQGDPSIDSIVKDTIQRLPFYCLIESRDRIAGNTLLMLSCQVGAMDLVSMLLSKGSDLNAINMNGETCLHFVCYNDSYSPEIAKVRIEKDVH